MSKNNLHIGNLIKKRLREQERTVSWFARQLHCDRSNIYKILKRQSIDTDLLWRISVALGHNFFRYYSEQLEE